MGLNRHLQAEQNLLHSQPLYATLYPHFVWTIRGKLMKRYLALLAIACLGGLLPAANAPAHADCAGDQCSSQQPSGASYGAIAYDRTNNTWSISSNQATAEAASTDAMQKCAKGGGACEFMAHFNDSCAALAIGKHGKGLSIVSAISKSEKMAQDEAVTRCQLLQGENCESKASVCSRR